MTLKKLTPRQTWDMALGDLSKGRRNQECVRAFESFTGDMLAAKLITIDEFIGAQTVIVAAYKGAGMLKKIAA